jgi:HSP20 family protein
MTEELRAWSPMVSELNRFNGDIDKLFERWFGRRIDGGKGTGVLNPALESFVTDGKMVIRIDLPGIEPSDVEVMVTGHTLTIRGKREQRHEEKGRDWFRREVDYGSFERSVELPEGIKPEEITASYRNGVLELTAPMPESAVARKIPIEGGDSSRAQSA